MMRPRGWMTSMVFGLGAVLMSIAYSAEPKSCDVLVYGGTPGGVAAAVAAARQGHKVTLAEPGYFVGGMMAGGLTKTDLGNRSTIGGISREFFDRVLAYYKKTYGENSEQAKQTRQGAFFEPKVAALIFRQMLDEAGVDVMLKYRLEKVEVVRNVIKSSLLVPVGEGGDNIAVTAKVFVDATYEGDLLAAAGVPYRVGREAQAEYDEPLAGIAEGLEAYLGKGDHRVQAYNIRSTITNRADILVPFPKPADYDPAPHEHFIKHILKHNLKTFEDLFHDAPLWGEVNGKLDPNKADAVGLNYNYAEADAEGRARIVQRIQDYWLSLWYMLSTDPRLPEEFRKSVAKWGLPADEFVESGHVTPQVYVRVARRMLGRYMLTQKDAQDERFKEDAICLGSYNIDSHDVQRMLTPEGLTNEGYIIQPTDPYEIPYRSITPFAPKNLLVVCAVSATHIAYGTLRMEPVFMMIGEAAGRAAHLAMAGRSSVQDIDIKALQQQLRDAGIKFAAPFRPKVEIKIETSAPYSPGQELVFRADILRKRGDVTRLEWNFDGSGAVQASGEVVCHAFPRSGRFPVSLYAEDADGFKALLAETEIQVGVDRAEPIEVLFKDAKAQGRWDRAGSGLVSYRTRTPYHDMNAEKGAKEVVFETKLPKSGRYQVAVAYAESENNAEKIPVTIYSANGTKEVVVDQRKKSDPFAFEPLGEFSFEANQPARVIIANRDTSGFVVVDAVRWIPVEP